MSDRIKKGKLGRCGACLQRNYCKGGKYDITV